MRARSGLCGRIWAVVAPANLLLAGISCGGVTDVPPAEPAGGTAGTSNRGNAGSPGGSGGSAPQPSLTLGDVTVAPSGACSSNPVGTCCDYEPCFTREQINELNSQRPGGVTVAEGCPPPPPMNGFCTFFESGPTMKNGLCCYRVSSGTCCGRRFVVSGHDRRASLVAREDWRAADDLTGSDHELTAASRDALSRVWAEDALLEHASIASFNWFTLELLHLGAPAALIRVAQQAALDEIKHAELCFELASRFAGTKLGPGPLAITGLATRDLAELAVAVLLEGCIGETLAAALAEAQLARCGDEQCRAALSVIVADEADHAVLAWRFLRHALEREGGAVTERVRQAWVAAPRTLSSRQLEVPAEVWNHYGRLTPEQEQAVVEQTFRQLIEPAVAAVLRASFEDSEALPNLTS